MQVTAISGKPHHTLLGFLVAGLALPPLLVTWFSLQRERALVRSANVSLLEARVDEVGHTLEAMYGRYQAEVLRSARDPAIIAFCAQSPALRQGSLASIHERIEVFRGDAPAVRGVSVLDTSGTVIATTERPLLGQNLAYHPVFQSAVAGAEAVSDVYISSPETGRVPSVAFAAPVRTTAGVIAGVYALAVRAEALWDVMRAANDTAGKGSFFAIFDQYGIRAGHSRNEGLLFHPSVPLSPEAVRTMLANRRFQERTAELLSTVIPFPFEVVRSPERTVFWRPDSPTNHVPNLAASRRFPLIRGTVVAHVPRSEVEVGILSVFPRVLPGFAVGLLLAIVGGVLLVRLRRSKEALEESFAQVRESASRFRSLTELSSDWYWEQDENLHLIGVTQAGGNVPRYTANLGKAFWEERAITPSSGAWDDLKAAMAARKPFRDFELQHTAHDATVRYLSISGMPILADDGAFRGYRGTARDISERKRAEELTKALAASEEDKRLKNEFLTNMSHELRTPLNAILGFTELVQAGEAGPVSARQREFLDQALSSGRHLLRLINDVLALTRMESGKLELHSEPVDVPALVGEVISNVKETAEKGRIQIRTEVDETIGHVVADPSYLKQVLFNYLSNALKFTPAGGSVVVRARPEGPDAFALEVEDTGVGIEPEDLSRLFVEFQQLDAGYAKKYGGTGLGLALTKRLVEAQGGSVGVRSRPGQGSVFRAILPRRASPSGGAAREPV